MTTSQRLERIENGWLEIQEALKALTQATGAIAASVAAHDDQIDKLVQVAEIQQQRWEQLQREWQAYLTTVHPRQ